MNSRLPLHRRRFDLQSVKADFAVVGVVSTASHGSLSSNSNRLIIANASVPLRRQEHKSG